MQALSKWQNHYPQKHNMQSNMTEQMTTNSQGNHKQKELG